MKASLFLATSAATLAFAVPIEQSIVTEVAIDTAYITVTVTGEPRFFHGQYTIPTATSEQCASTVPPPPPAEPAASFAAPPPLPLPLPTPDTTPVPPPVPGPAQGPQPVKDDPDPAPAPAPVAAPAEDYLSIALHYHNVHRSNHSANALTWSDTHAEYARQTAQSCVFKHNLSPGGGGYGQNLAMFGSSNANPSCGPGCRGSALEAGLAAKECHLLLSMS